MADQNTSKTLVLTGYGGYDKMSVMDKPRPSPKPGQVLVHIKANGINFAELMARQGLYDNSPKTPAVLGMEGGGDVVALGEGVTDLKVNLKLLFTINYWVMYYYSWILGFMMLSRIMPCYNGIVMQQLHNITHRHHSGYKVGQPGLKHLYSN